MASVKINPKQPPPAIEPTEVYHANYPSTSPIKLRIAAGGAGQSGLIRAISNAFILHKVQNSGVQPFAIAWFASDTSISFNSLAQNVVDLSLTYHEAAERTAIRQGIADRHEYAFRDHWMLVGPKNNPASLQVDDKTTIYDLLTQFFCAAIETSTSKNPVRFLSRYDKSACNIKESHLWTAIGQTPWSYPYSNWYHRYVDFPFQALAAAAKLEEYTLTDRGTWLSVEEWVRDRMTVFMASSDDLSDLLLNPAHIMVGSRGLNKALANELVDWLIAPDGQKVISELKNNGVVLYTGAPPRETTDVAEPGNGWRHEIQS